MFFKRWVKIQRYHDDKSRRTNVILQDSENKFEFRVWHFSKAHFQASGYDSDYSEEASTAKSKRFSNEMGTIGMLWASNYEL